MVTLTELIDKMMSKSIDQVQEILAMLILEMS